MLRRRAFALLFYGQAFSLFGDVLFRIALPFAVLELSRSAAAVGIVVAAQFVPFVAFALVGGAWADRLGPRRVMVASDVARTLLQAATAALLLAGEATVWQLTVLSALYGVADAFFAPALSGLVPAAAGPEHLQEANALLTGARNAAQIIGSPIAGVLVAVLGPGTSILADAGTFLVSAALLLRLPLARPVHDVAPEKTLRAIATGWREVRARPWLRSFLGVLLVYHLFVLPCVFVLGPVIADRSLGGAGAWGVISGGFGVGALAGSLIVLRWRPARPMLVAGLACVFASTQAAVIGSGAGTLVIAAMEALAGVAVSPAFILWETALGRHVPQGGLSRVTSFDLLASNGALPVGMALVGPLADGVGLRTTMIGATVVGAAISLGYVAQPSVRALD